MPGRKSSSCCGKNFIGTYKCVKVYQSKGSNCMCNFITEVCHSFMLFISYYRNSYRLLYTFMNYKLKLFVSLCKLLSCYYPVIEMQKLFNICHDFVKSVYLFILKEMIVHKYTMNAQNHPQQK